MEEKMSHAREEGQGPTRLQDQYGNMIPQPSATAMYGAPSEKGGAIYGGSTGDAEAFISNYYGGQPQQHRAHHDQGEPRLDDPTQRRGTTTGEYGDAGVGFVDRAKDKLANIGGFKEDPGHVSTSGEPMEAMQHKSD